MPPRVTAADVTVILDTSLTTEQVEGFIDGAHELVDYHLGSEGLNYKLLREIERYVAAHLCTLRDQRVASESADGVSFKFQGQTGKGLEATHYGQTAMEMDPTGNLAGLGNEQRQGFVGRIATEKDYPVDPNLP